MLHALRMACAWPLLLLCAAVLVAAGPTLLETARDLQDRGALEKIINDSAEAAAKAPTDAEAQYRVALASCYLAEVEIEQHDKKSARPVAEKGIKAAERAVQLKPDSAEYYRVLATLYGQAITDVMSGLSYGPKAKNAVNKAVEMAPHNSGVYVARGVGNYYLPAQLGGGPAGAIPDFQKAIQLDPNNAEAYLWLGVSLRAAKKDDEARQAFQKSLALNPNRVWVKQQLDKTPATPAK